MKILLHVDTHLQILKILDDFTQNGGVSLWWIG